MNRNIFTSNALIALELHFINEREFVVYNLNSAWNEQRDRVEEKDIWLTGYVRSWDLEEVRFLFRNEDDSSTEFLGFLIKRIEFINNVLKGRASKIILENFKKIV